MKRDREFAGSGKLNHISSAMMDSPRDPLKGGFLFLPAVLPREAPAIKIAIKSRNDFRESSTETRCAQRKVAHLRLPGLAKYIFSSQIFAEARLSVCMYAKYFSPSLIVQRGADRTFRNFQRILQPGH